MGKAKFMKKIKKEKRKRRKKKNQKKIQKKNQKKIKRKIKSLLYVCVACLCQKPCCQGKNCLSSAR
jgi:F0F1-type ATP synthase epsilon subunit